MQQKSYMDKDICSSKARVDGLP